MSDILVDIEHVDDSTQLSLQNRMDNDVEDVTCDTVDLDSSAPFRYHFIHKL